MSKEHQAEAAYLSIFVLCCWEVFAKWRVLNAYLVRWVTAGRIPSWSSVKRVSLLFWYHFHLERNLCFCSKSASRIEIPWGK